MSPSGEGRGVDVRGELVVNPIAIIEDGCIGKRFESATCIAIVLIHSNQIRGETMHSRMGVDAD